MFAMSACAHVIAAQAIMVHARIALTNAATRFRERGFLEPIRADLHPTTDETDCLRPFVGHNDGHERSRRRQLGESHVCGWVFLVHATAV
jgi:hypothetical protein